VTYQKGLHLARPNPPRVTLDLIRGSSIKQLGLAVVLAMRTITIYMTKVSLQTEQLLQFTRMCGGFLTKITRMKISQILKEFYEDSLTVGLKVQKARVVALSLSNSRKQAKRNPNSLKMILDSTWIKYQSQRKNYINDLL